MALCSSSLSISPSLSFSWLGGRNPKLSRGLGGAVPWRPGPHSGANIFNGLRQEPGRARPPAYWYPNWADSNWCSAGEGRGGHTWKDDAFVSLYVWHPDSSSSSCHHHQPTPSFAHTHLSFTLKVLANWSLAGCLKTRGHSTILVLCRNMCYVLSWRCEILRLLVLCSLWQL